MKNLIQNSQEADMIGYWVATDLFSDYYDTKRILFGGCGLITRERREDRLLTRVANSDGETLIRAELMKKRKEKQT